MTHPIADLVSPFMLQAMDEAERRLRLRIEHILDHLKKNGYDLNLAFPRPHGRMCRADYHLFRDRRQMVERLTEPVSNDTRSSFRRDVENIRKPELRQSEVNRLAEGARAAAQMYFESWMAKMIAKLDKSGATADQIERVQLSSDSVWSNSTLYVRLKDGTEQAWNTKVIMNVSKLGKLFNQWPTRRVR